LYWKKRFELALEGEATDRPPAVIPTKSATLELMKASRSHWPMALKDPRLMAKLAMAPHAFAGIESVSLPFDKWVEPEAMGLKVHNWSRSKLPEAAPLIDNFEDFDKIKMPDPRRDGRMRAVTEAVKLLSKKVGDRLPIIASIDSPFEIVSSLWNPNTLINYVEYWKEPLHHLLSISTLVAASYAEELVKAGATAILIDDGTSQNLFGAEMQLEYQFDGVEPEYYLDYSARYVKKLVAGLDSPTILHVCGDTKVVLDHMAEVGADGLSIDQVDVAEAKRLVGDKCSIIGNVSVYELNSSSPEEVSRKARVCLEQAVDILAPGCNLIPSTPTENLKALARAPIEWNTEELKSYERPWRRPMNA